MKRSINVVDLENRIQNNLNPSVKCKKETNEPKEVIKSKDNQYHPSYDDENDWKKEYFDDDVYHIVKDEDIDLRPSKDEDKINLFKVKPINDDYFHSHLSKSITEALEKFKKLNEVSPKLGCIKIPQDVLDYIKEHKDFIPSSIYNNINDGNLYLTDEEKDVKETRKFCADRIRENEKRKAEGKQNNGYAFADIDSLSKNCSYINPNKLNDIKEDLPSIDTARKYENVNHPQHYNNYSKEVIDMMMDVFGKENTALFCEMNAFKYRMRMGTKPGNDINQDLDKEQWYLNKAKELRD